MGQLRSRSHSFLQIKMALTEEQAVFLLDSRNSFLHSMGYHSAALRKLQQQLSVSCNPIGYGEDPALFTSLKLLPIHT